MTFKEWFDDMEERYQASYGSYEQLLQEAFEAGAKQEREACAKVCEEMRDAWVNRPVPLLGYAVEHDGAAKAIRARAQADRGEA